MKNMKLSLVLAAAVIAGGLSAVYPAPAVPSEGEGAKPVLETLPRFPGAQFNIDLPIPVLRAAAPVIWSDTAAMAGNADCTPSSAIIPGTDFSPKINDSIRTAAIIGLLDKISACKPLPYAQDGITNNNQEGGMPQAPAGYYKEYTLDVPGRVTGDGPEPINIGGRIYMSGPVLSKRGPERIIIGGGKSVYYTPDHYKTFIGLTIVK